MYHDFRAGAKIFQGNRARSLAASSPTRGTSRLFLPRRFPNTVVVPMCSKASRSDSQIRCYDISRPLAEPRIPHGLRDVAVPATPTDAVGLVEKIMAIACRSLRILIDGDDDRLDVQKTIALPRCHAADLC
jgi:hypothetical protein